jgi:hypothetical protein
MKSRFNRKVLIALPLAVLSLVSCKDDVSEVYGQHPYDTGSFIDNYFVGRDDFKDKRASVATLRFETVNAFVGLNESGVYTGFTPAKTKYPSLFVDKNGNALSTTNNIESEYNDWNAETLGGDSNYIGHSFGRTLCLAKTDGSFKNGVLSKLYDGQLHCNGCYSKARIQLTSDGYAGLFPKTMDTADYLVLVGRWADNSIVSDEADVNADIKVSFYKKNGASYDEYDVTMEQIPFEKNGGGDRTTLFGFKFSDALPSFDLSGIVGMGVSYSNVKNGGTDYTDGKVTFTNEEKEGVINSSLMLYETMLVNSTWH